MSKKLLVVDGSALIHRAFHALPELTNSKGLPKGAVYGFAKMFLKTIKDTQPDYVLVAMDRREPTFRKELYIGYQANRPPADPSLSVQFGMVRDLLSALEVTMLDKAGYEADDVIGTIVERVAGSVQNSEVSNQSREIDDKSEEVVSNRKSSDSGEKHRNDDFTPVDNDISEVVVLTGDKDLMQLVNGRVKLRVPVRGVSEVEEYDQMGVVKKLGVRPDQVVDLKGLIGDPSDNYPGVYGIGPKTAEKLLAEFGDFESIYQYVDGHIEIDDEKIAFKKGDGRGFSKGVWKKLIAGRAEGELSKKLAQIKRDVDGLTWDWDQSEAVVKSPGKLVKVLEENEFGSLIRQLGLDKEVGEGEQLALV